MIAHTQNHQAINTKRERNILLIDFGFAVVIAGCSLIFGCTDLIIKPTTDDNRAGRQPNVACNPCADSGEMDQKQANYERISPLILGELIKSPT